jgi:hypothetical protein
MMAAAFGGEQEQQRKPSPDEEPKPARSVQDIGRFAGQS